jgi:hypothetical protein
VARRQLEGFGEDGARLASLARPERVRRARHDGDALDRVVERLRLGQLLADERDGARRLAEDLRRFGLRPRLRPRGGGQEAERQEEDERRRATVLRGHLRVPPLL